MKKYRVLIVDDEPLMCDEIALLLGECCPEAEVIGTCFDGKSAFSLISKEKPDIIFLDIHMPEMTGLMLAELINSLPHPPFVIFCTAYSEFALDAFQVNAVGYIMKPIDEKDIRRIMDKINHLTENFEDQNTANPSHHSYSRKFAIEFDDKHHIIDVSSIQMIFAENRQVFVQTIEGKTWRSRLTLQEFEAKLDPKQFMRCHRNFIVNLECIEEFTTWFNRGYLLKLRGKQPAEAPVSRNYVPALRQHIQF
ncbi:Transcriptional regulatory protein YpdB [bioreactor metagenome]|uniref:Transcriptional regulatory protein YpdB n=1 Tax=bioreactor metagenome TaxID=1076179 RepID=A0A644TR88_9ZZZZ|nr:LytTR family DNA-binding domain-containing protein [Negativicutes bacterium]